MFASFAPDELSDISWRLRPVSLRAGDTLFSEGDVADAMYVVERGELGVITEAGRQGRVMLAELSTGAVVGEMALLHGAVRSATVEAVSQTNGYRLDRASFDELRSTGSRGAYKLLLHLAMTLDDRKRATEQRIRGLLDDPERAHKLHSRDVRELAGILRKA